MNPNINNEIVRTLDDVKNVMRNYIDTSLSLFEVRYLNRNITSSFYECDLVYLHIKIMFGSPNDVNNFLENYYNLHGLYATHMFINHPLIDIENNMNITPLDCATLWNVDPHMIRVLYKWGCDTSIPNIDGRYHNDYNELKPYRNYLSRYVLNENNFSINNNNQLLRGRRIYNEFSNVLREISYIAGEDNIPSGWHMPVRVQPPRQININDHQY